MAIISGSDLEYLSERFETELKSDVQLHLYTRASFHSAEAIAEAEASEVDQEQDETGEVFMGEACRMTANILEELAAIDPEHLEVVRHDLDSLAGQAEAQAAGLDGEMLPVTFFQSENLKGQSRYFGLPSGYEFGSLVESLIDFSIGTSGLKPGTLEKLAAVEEPVQIIIFVTPT